MLTGLGFVPTGFANENGVCSVLALSVVALHPVVPSARSVTISKAVTTIYVVASLALKYDGKLCQR